jgi:hypothetical protein
MKRSHFYTPGGSGQPAKRQQTTSVAPPAKPKPKSTVVSNANLDDDELVLVSVSHNVVLSSCPVLTESGETSTW